MELIFLAAVGRGRQDKNKHTGTRAELDGDICATGKQKARSADSEHQLWQRRPGKASLRRGHVNRDSGRAREGAMLCGGGAFWAEGRPSARCASGTVLSYTVKSQHQPGIRPLTPILTPDGCITVPTPSHRGLQCVSLGGGQGTLFT